MREKRFLMDVGMNNLPFPIRVMSRVKEEGQSTVANISITARIMQEFEAKWIDKFIQILHQHREHIGTKTLKINIVDYLKELDASTVKINFEYPFFVEKLTPVSREKCLVKYQCEYSAKISSVEKNAKAVLKMEIPVITTYPASISEKPKGLFGQLSIVSVEVEGKSEIYPEDIIDIVDGQSLIPVYSFLTPEDQAFVIEKIHSERKTSVVMIDEIKEKFAHNHNINWYSIKCFNFGMLHTYSTVIKTAKSMWVPFSSYGE